MRAVIQVNSLAFLTALFFAPGQCASNASASTTSACFYNCRGVGGNSPSIPIWIWQNAPLSQGLGNSFTTTTLEKIVITVINTDNGITNTVTSYPSNYTAPLSSSNGTAISAVTFTRSDQVLTTTVTFPAAFADWPDSYTWTGIFTNAPSCVPSCGVAIISSNPPITTGDDRETTYGIYPNPTHSGYNPEGSGYFLVPGWWDDSLFGLYRSLFPDQPAVQSCAPDMLDGGPEFPPFTVTEWSTRPSTSFTGKGVSTEIPSPGSTAMTPGPTRTTTASTVTDTNTGTTQTAHTGPASSAEQPSPTKDSTQADATGTNEPGDVSSGTAIQSEASETGQGSNPGTSSDHSETGTAGVPGTTEESETIETSQPSPTSGSTGTIGTSETNNADGTTTGSPGTSGGTGTEAAGSSQTGNAIGTTAAGTSQASEITGTSGTFGQDGASSTTALPSGSSLTSVLATGASAPRGSLDNTMLGCYFAVAIILSI
ncbi:hypothetical protein F5Y14DRAFT_171518 [Nemania sp. NC0429]|nr:hypothetical protein F5Y14DRAFT_171518 [Nemania sp. NC0429]